MKRADIKKLMESDTEVAIRMRGGHNFDRYARRGVVIGMDAQYRSHEGRYSQKTTNGIRVRFTDGKPNPGYSSDWARIVTEFRGGYREGDILEDTDDRVVPSRLFISPWEDYARMANDMDAAAAKARLDRAAEEARAARERDECEAAIAKLKAVGVNARVVYESYGSTGSPGYYRVAMAAGKAAEFADRLAARLLDELNDDKENA